MLARFRVYILSFFCLFNLGSYAFALDITGKPEAPNPIVTMLPLVAIIVFFYFFMIRPQQKKHKETTDMLSNLNVGDKVATSSGIIGKISRVNSDSKRETVYLLVNENVEMVFYKSAIVEKMDSIEDKKAN